MMSKQASLSAFFTKRTDAGLNDSAATPDTKKRKLPSSFASPSTSLDANASIAATQLSAPATTPAPDPPAQPPALCADSVAQSAQPVATAVWLWQSGQSWTAYSAEQSESIERAYVAKESRAPLDSSRHIDFQSMRQVCSAQLNRPPVPAQKWPQCLSGAVRRAGSGRQSQPLAEGEAPGARGTASGRG